MLLTLAREGGGGSIRPHKGFSNGGTTFRVDPHADGPLADDGVILVDIFWGTPSKEIFVDLFWEHLRKLFLLSFLSHSS